MPGAPHSIAEIVAHLAFWLDWFCRRCEGNGQPMVAKAAHGWPDVTAGSWTEIQTRFLAGLDRLAALGVPDARLHERVTPPIEFPPLSNFTIRDALGHVANHNAHHIGQVILLRQLMGLWPPPSGSWTW